MTEQLGVASASAAFEPGTAATTATTLPRFPDGTALGAYGPDGRRGRGFWHLYAGIGQRNKEKIAQQSLFSRVIACYDLNLRLQAFTPSDHL